MHMVKKQSKQIKIAKELISMTSKNATKEVPGVHSVKDIKVEVSDDMEANIDVVIISDFGIKIPDLAFNVQNKVKESVEQLTEFKVNTVDIQIKGVKLIKE